MQPSASSTTEFASDVRAGLTRTGQKELPSKYLYDALGSSLFEAITYLPEYGLTRADRRLLNAHAADIVRDFGPAFVIAELGSGSGQKTRILLEACASRPRYYPIDVSSGALAACEDALADIADLVPVHGTYLEGLSRVTSERTNAQPLLLFFLGSTIGNFDRHCAAEFLAAIRDRLKPGDGFLLGADLVKPAAQLIPAYDDPTGVTAAFNRNLLGRINRELGGDFDLRSFEHQARFNEQESRIEMHLRSTVDQEAFIRASELHIQFAKGETIWTESSYKFRPAELDKLARDTGFHVRTTWIDDEWPFAETLWIAL